MKLLRNHFFTLDRPACLLAMLLVLTGFPAITAAEGEKPWSAELHVKRYLGSHTSYEFGNPFEPYQAPLSRLEFPLDTWWAGGEFRRNFSRISAGVEVLRNISRESDDSFKDSDWDDEERPDVKSIYSESQCRMAPSYMVRGDVELKVADWLGLPVRFELRPVAGVRWQRLTLVAHDGVQTYPAPGDNTPPEVLPGDGIRFEQTYWQYFLGIKAAYDLGAQRNVSRMTGSATRKPRPAGGDEGRNEEQSDSLSGSPAPWAVSFTLLGQLDWAYVDGDNSDNHLLREGNRMTYERTRGDAWHASLGLKAGLGKNINMGVEAEYLLIRTKGSHRLANDLMNLDMSWDNGVKVWSEQMSLMMSLEYLF